MTRTRCRRRSTFLAVAAVQAAIAVSVIAPRPATAADPAPVPLTATIDFQGEAIGAPLCEGAYEHFVAATSVTVDRDVVYRDERLAYSGQQTQVTTWCRAHSTTGGSERTHPQGIGMVLVPVAEFDAAKLNLLFAEGRQGFSDMSSVFPNAWPLVGPLGPAHEVYFEDLTTATRTLTVQSEYLIQDTTPLGQFHLVTGSWLTGFGPPTVLNGAVSGTFPILTIRDRSSSTVSAHTATVMEGQDSTAEIPVTVDPPADEPVSVVWQTTDATAVAGHDYVSTSGLLTIPAGAGGGTITVPIVDDGLPELDEAFGVVLNAVIGPATIEQREGEVTILDDDAGGVRVVVDESNSHGYLTGTAQPPEPGCPIDLEVESLPAQPLWAEITFTPVGGVALPTPSEPIAGLGLLPPAGYGDLPFEACFRTPGQALQLHLDTGSAKAIAMQVLEILWAATGTSLTGLINDGQLLGELLAAVPPSLTNGLVGCSNDAPPGALLLCSTSVLADSLLGHFDEWAAMGNRLLQVAPDVFVVQEIARFFQAIIDGGAEVWQRISPQLLNVLGGNESQAAVERAADAEARHLDQLNGQEDKLFDWGVRLEENLVVDRGVLADNQAALAEAKGALADCVARGCPRDELGPLKAAVRTFERAVVRNQLAVGRSERSLAAIRAALSLLGDEISASTRLVGGLRALARAVPVLGLLAQAWTTGIETWAQREGKASTSDLYFIACPQTGGIGICAS